MQIVLVVRESLVGRGSSDRLLVQSAF